MISFMLATRGKVIGTKPCFWEKCPFDLAGSSWRASVWVGIPFSRRQRRHRSRTGAEASISLWKTIPLFINHNVLALGFRATRPLWHRRITIGTTCYHKSKSNGHSSRNEHQLLEHYAQELLCFSSINGCLTWYVTGAKSSPSPSKKAEDSFSREWLGIWKKSYQRKALILAYQVSLEESEANDKVALSLAAMTFASSKVRPCHILFNNSTFEYIRLESRLERAKSHSVHEHVMSPSYNTCQIVMSKTLNPPVNTFLFSRPRMKNQEYVQHVQLPTWWGWILSKTYPSCHSVS